MRSNNTNAETATEIQQVYCAPPPQKKKKKKTQQNKTKQNKNKKTTPPPPTHTHKNITFNKAQKYPKLQQIGLKYVGQKGRIPYL